MAPPAHIFTAEELRAAFDRAPEFTVGLEEEVFVCAPEDGTLVPAAAEVLALLEGDDRFKPEMPAGQLEIVTGVHASAAEAVENLRAARRALLDAVGGKYRFIAAGVHPLAPAESPPSPGERYAKIYDTYGVVARRQQVSALHVHVAVPGSELALATYNALRAHLPELSALAASSPFHEGRDTGLASVRPTIATSLPRQGLPPALGSWQELADAYAALGDASQWWWEMRPHPIHGTLELRVPDAQPGISDVATVVNAAVGLVRRMAEQGGGPVRTDWRISENRWSALRHGLAGEMWDMETDSVIPTRERMAHLGIRAPEREPAALMREVGVDRVTTWLMDRFEEGV